MREGERKLRAAFQRLGRGQRASAPAPLDPRPTNAFELWAVNELKGLRQDVDDIKKRVDWLTLAIVGASLTFILETIFS